MVRTKIPCCFYVSVVGIDYCRERERKKCVLGDRRGSKCINIANDGGDI